MFKLKLFLPLLVLAFLVYLNPVSAQTSCTENSVVNFVARDPGGSYIASARVDIYLQELDVNGQPKPGSRVGGGTTDANLGRARISWRNSANTNTTYAIRVQVINKDRASFWFYDYNVACGEERTIEESLSGLNFTFRDASGNSLKNLNFNVYAQARDTGGSVINAKDLHMSGLNSGSSGQAKIYLPQGSVRSIDKVPQDYYVMEVSHNNSMTTLYGLYVSDGSINNINFYLSRWRLRLYDARNQVASGAKVEVYKQESDTGGQPRRGAKVGELTIDNEGYAYMDMMPGLYALAVKGSGSDYHYFWSINIANTQNSSHNLNLPADFNLVGVCQETSQVNIALQSVAGLPSSGLKFELYEQETDAGSLPVVGKRVSSGTLNSSGRATVSFKPDSQKFYTLKVWDKKADQGEFWFFNALRFVCGYDRNLNLTTPALKIVWRDKSGGLKSNYNFSLWSQAYDADGRPILANNGKIADLRTDAGGQATVFVSPYNTYRAGQSGVYALTARDDGGNTVTFYDVAVSADRDNTFTAQASGLGGNLQDARQRQQANKEIKLYQILGSGDNRRLGDLLARFKSNASGRFDFEYPAGTYALVVNDDFNQESIFWDVSIRAGAPSRNLVMNLINFSLSSGTAEELPREPTIKLYSLAGSNATSYVRDREIASFRLNSGKTALKSLAAGPYLALYVGQNNKEYGLAFYAAAGESQNINLRVSSAQALTAGQSFRLNVPSASAGSSGGSPTSAMPGLNGRILLQVEDKGQAWYVNPVDGKRYYLGRPHDAFEMMRRLSLGISNQNFSALENNPAAWRHLSGRILLKTEDLGKAYYFDPLTLNLHFLGRPQDAFNVMRNLGLGITNANLSRIGSSQ